ncbi:transposase [Mesorhizobium sp. M0814]|uniref:transposase n=1 Tax=Mesorhizobium sp. M0814 TaxID=2957004 RepID=UPI00333935E4
MASFVQVEVVRPDNTIEEGLPKTVSVSLVQVTEVDPPQGAEPILWRLLTTHRVEDAAMAWRMVDWYRMRWTIEQFFRTLKQQGLQLEDSQLETAERLVKLTAIAARAACVVMQLVQARDGRSAQHAAIAFTHAEIDTLQALLPHWREKPPCRRIPTPPIPRLGRLDYRQTRRLGRLSKVQSPRTHHLPTRIAALPVHRPWMGASKCVNRLAVGGGR